MGCKEELQVCLLAMLYLQVCLFVVLAGHVGFAGVLFGLLAGHVGFAGVLAALEDMLTMNKLLV